MDIDHDLGKIYNNLTTIDPGNTTLTISGNTGIIVPSGTTLNRPAPTEGVIRRNTTTGYVEVYSNSQWVDIKNYSLSGLPTGGAASTVLIKNSATDYDAYWGTITADMAPYAKQLVAFVKNETASTITKGNPVYQIGNVGSSWTIAVGAADAADINKMPAIGVLAQDLAPGATGDMIVLGEIRDVNTSSFAEGELVYVAPGGGYTNTKPTNVNYAVQFLGIVTKIHATNGGGYVTGTGTLDLFRSDIGGFYGWNGTQWAAITGSGTTSHAVLTNRSDADQHPISAITGLQTALDGKESLSNKGIANGYCPLDATAKVSSTYLPSYVDDVIEASLYALLPITGETGKIYVTLDTNKTYRWSGSAYVEISASPGTTDALTEGVANLYFTDTRAQNAITGGASSIVTSNLTINRALVSDASGKVSISPVTSTELGYVSGVTSGIQPQLNSKQSTLVSGTNIKTVAGYNIIGAGDQPIALNDLSDTTVTSPVVGQTLTYDGTQWINLGSASGPGGAAKRIWSGNVTSLSGTTVITPGTTAPLVTAGTQVWTVTVTPLSTTSSYVIQSNIAVAASLNNANLTLALFRNNTYIGGTLQIVASGTNSSTLSFSITDLPATTSPVVYQVRVGTNTGTWYVNRRAAENTYGGFRTGWVIWEY